MYYYLLLLFLHISPIISTIEILKTHENTNITIVCHFNSTKFNSNILEKNIILWYKDDTQVIGVNSISNNPKKFFLNQVDIYTYQLIIINVQLESSGLYKCQNFMTKEEKYFQLNVFVPPSALRLIPSTQLPVIDGTTTIFYCSSERVYPNPIFEWYKNDKLLQRSIGNQTNSTFFSSSSILTLLLTPADHNHILRCRVSNEASIHETNIEIKLEILFKPIIKIFFHQKEIIKKSLIIIENTLEKILCQISSNPSIISKIEWFKNDQLIEGENNEQLAMNFTGIEKLSCRAKNNIGQTEENIHINILYKPKLSMIKNLTINHGEKMSLKCLINSNPPCQQIRWLFNEKELFIQSCSKQNIAEYFIENIDRLHAGKYTCEVKNLLNTNSEYQLDGISMVSTDVRVQYVPIILNTFKKLAVVENYDIRTECLIDAYPKAEIIWLGPSGQKLSTFVEEKIWNNTVVSSEIHLPSSYSSILGTYRCIAKNNLGEQEFPIEFQRPSLPDPPYQLVVINITHSSFILNWESGFDGGSEQIFHIILISNHTDERFSSVNSIRFEDLNENTRYIIKIRSKNDRGFSNYSKTLIVQTKQSSIRLEEFPMIERAYYTKDNHRIRFQLSPTRSKLITTEQLCIQYYNIDEMSTCIPINSIELINNGLEINIEQRNLRLKLCLINQTDICSKSITIPTDIQLANNSSELILILIGGILGLCFVLSLIGLCIYIQKKKQKHLSKNGSTDTLKTNSSQFHSVRVSDMNTNLYYPTRNQTRPLYYNDETTGVYSIQNKKNSICFDSGMISTTSDSIGSSDFYDRSDGDYLVNGKLSQENPLNIPVNGRISSEEESGFSTPTKPYRGKKLVYEVVV